MYLKNDNKAEAALKLRELLYSINVACNAIFISQNVIGKTPNNSVVANCKENFIFIENYMLKKWNEFFFLVVSPIIYCVRRLKMIKLQGGIFRDRCYKSMFLKPLFLELHSGDK